MERIDLLKTIKPAPGRLFFIKPLAGLQEPEVN